MQHTDQHTHAFIDHNNQVVQLAAFDENAHNNHQMFEFFCETYGYKKAICCCAHGEPYIGDVWDETNEEWIVNLDVRTRFNTVIIDGEEVTTPKAITNADTSTKS
jgi:hypothetical protein